VDAFEANDRLDAQTSSPAQKLAQSLEMMSTGIRLKRLALRQRFPTADEPEIDRLLTAWLSEDA